MPALIDLKGQRFGRLLVLEKVVVPKARNAMWRCQCDCGKETVAAGPNLGRTTFSCGCYVRENNARLNRTHGMTNTTEFNIWQGMQQRCHNPNTAGYENYGARGISVCKRWRDDFRNFLFDMGRRPSKKHSIDRINNDGNYEPGNCRWATTKEQNRNYSLTNLIEIDGVTMCALDWCNSLNVDRQSVYSRAKQIAKSGEKSVGECVEAALREIKAKSSTRRSNGGWR